MTMTPALRARLMGIFKPVFDQGLQEAFLYYKPGSEYVPLQRERCKRMRILGNAPVPNAPRADAGCIRCASRFKGAFRGPTLDACARGNESILRLVQ
ncbi:MAG: hypothetical protein IT489_11920 [Gammaproteobacteria bacterium]|nr:hypothetical protein [Gammaproteobacteria bacterium]